MRSNTGGRTAGMERNAQKRDGAREREEIERSWDVLGKSITPNFDPGSSHAPEILGRSSQLQGRFDVGGARGSAGGLAFPVLAIGRWISCQARST
jgi:hypothetical protein